jgi:flagellar biosynthesis GTPase FlhF
VKIKSFYADSIESALHSASREMGEEALILNTRETPAEFRHYGRYEVVCAVAVEPERGNAAVEPAAQRNEKAKRRTAQARLVFLVGPSGSGKSTCCAKIAIHSKFHQGTRPGILTWDTSRVGAADSVRAYCEIGDLNFRMIDRSEDLHSTLAEWEEEDLILVDTPALEGNPDTQEELGQLLAAFPRAEVHLVLSSTYSDAYLRRCWQSYRGLGPEFLLPTHLDEARMDLSGAGLEGLRALTIRWCGTGRAVPEDLAEAGQVIERAAALDAPGVGQSARQPSPSRPETGAGRDETMASAESRGAARAAIESILEKFRRSDSGGNSRHGNETRTSAA